MFLTSYTGLMTAGALPADVWACPAAPATEETLLALVRRLAATPGIATLVLRDTVPPGYDHPSSSNLGVGGDDLGYVLTLRLALLRRDHMDPIDLDGGYDPAMSLPEFEDIHSLEYSQALIRVTQDWNALRDAASRDLLRRLLAAAQDTSGRRFRFLVKQRGTSSQSQDPSQSGWYGLWDNLDAPLPEVLHFPPGPAVPSQAAGENGFGEINYAPAAHAQCRVNLYALPPWIGPSPYIARDLLRTIDLLREQEPGWDGIVLDMTDLSFGDRLADLARGAAP